MIKILEGRLGFLRESTLRLAGDGVIRRKLKVTRDNFVKIT